MSDYTITSSDPIFDTLPATLTESGAKEVPRSLFKSKLEQISKFCLRPKILRRCGHIKETVQTWREASGPVQRCFGDCRRRPRLSRLLRLPGKRCLKIMHVVKEMMNQCADAAAAKAAAKVVEAMPEENDRKEITLAMQLRRSEADLDNKLINKMSSCQRSESLRHFTVTPRVSASPLRDTPP